MSHKYVSRADAIRDHHLAVGKSSVSLITPPCLSRLKHLINLQGGAIK